jgi:thiamine-phosphate pyrophosphorylase
VFPSVYAIITGKFQGNSALGWADRLAGAGVAIIQYRAKGLSSGQLLVTSRSLARLAHDRGFRLVINDRPDIAALAGAHGVHVGQDDLTVEQARRICGQGSWVGVSTHNLEQLRAAALTSADYIAIGPIFPTATKANPGPILGVEFIRIARALTEKPLVAIGGITAERAADVYRAGADAVAVASDLADADDLAGRVREYVDAASSAGVPSREVPGFGAGGIREPRE